jgi:heme exporter protein B
MLKEIAALIEKDIVLEWRQRYAFNGMLLYVVSTVFVVYMSFKLKQNSIEPITWNTLLWIILLFTAVNSVVKSFVQERAGRFLYYYTIVSPEAVILSKIIYNSLLMSVLSVIGLGVYMAMMDNHASDVVLYLISVIMGAIGFSCTLTMVAAIASKADNAATLMAVLSFPIILPMLMMLIRLSKNALDGLAWTASYDELGTLLGINIIVVALSYLLFPYLWRS